MTNIELDDLGYRQKEETNIIFENLIKDLVFLTIDEPQRIEIYGALCNTIWYNEDELAQYSCSWRSAGGLVAEFAGKQKEVQKDYFGEGRDWDMSYLEYYCSGGEGKVEPWIEAALLKDGWRLAFYEERKKI